MKFVTVVFFILLLSSCGSLKLSAQGCKSEGIWSSGESLEQNKNEQTLTETFYVWNADREVKIKDILKKSGIACKDIKKLWVSVNSKYLVERELNLHIEK